MESKKKIAYFFFDFIIVCPRAVLDKDYGRVTLPLAPRVETPLKKASPSSKTFPIWRCLIQHKGPFPQGDNKNETPLRTLQRSNAALVVKRNPVWLPRFHAKARL